MARTPRQRRLDVNQAAQRFRGEVLRGERAASMRLVAAHERAYDQISRDLDRLLDRVAAARAAGQEPGRAWLYQEARLRTLQAQVMGEISRFAIEARAVIGAEQARAAQQGAAAAGQMIALAVPEATAGVAASTVGLPTAAVETVVGALSYGSALDRRLAAYGPEAAARIARRLTTGLALGLNPRRIAAQVREDMGGSLTSALTTARTEVMRAWRESARTTYAANPDLAAGWIWWSALDRTTCASCIAQHGSRHPADEVMATHPRCRCVPIPDVRGSFGLPELETGPEWFERQPDEVKAEVLAPGKLAAYRGGRLTLPDLVQRERSRDWGPGSREAGLQTALAQASARRAARAAA